MGSGRQEDSRNLGFWRGKSWGWRAAETNLPTARFYPKLAMTEYILRCFTGCHGSCLLNINKQRSVLGLPVLKAFRSNLRARVRRRSKSFRWRNSEFLACFHDALLYQELSSILNNSAVSYQNSLSQVQFSKGALEGLPSARPWPRDMDQGATCPASKAASPSKAWHS